jgi:hypothetical protein
MIKKNEIFVLQFAAVTKKGYHAINKEASNTNLI